MNRPRATSSHPGRALVAGLLALVQLSCASAGLTPDQSPMPAARAALQPEYRVFYDTLIEYGDWKLIEPYGYVFRPRINFDSWRPYYDGYWAPTDVYGWVWVSAEPFGWATYHYGRWFYDSFQGWVWVPGVDWAPAWVAWQGTDDYVGWAPLDPYGSADAPVPGGSFLYVRPNDLASTNVRSEAVSAAKLGPALSRVRNIQNPDEADGVRFNRGPSLEAIERVTGPLVRVKVEEVVPAEVIAKRKSDAPAKTSELPVFTKRAGDAAAREARSARDTKSDAPARVTIVRPVRPADKSAPAPEAKKERKVRDAKADSTR